MTSIYEKRNSAEVRLIHAEVQQDILNQWESMVFLN